MRARVNKNVHVHKRPGKNTSYVEPEVLWVGYNVDIIDHYQGTQYRWAKISYLYNNEIYEGWVIEEALDIERQPDLPLDLPDIPVISASFPWRAAVACIVALLLLGAIFFAL